MWEYGEFYATRSTPRSTLANTNNIMFAHQTVLFWAHKLKYYTYTDLQPFRCCARDKINRQKHNNYRQTQSGYVESSFGALFMNREMKSRLLHGDRLVAETKANAAGFPWPMAGSTKDGSIIRVAWGYRMCKSEASIAQRIW